MPAIKITKQEVDKITSNGKEQLFWDNTLKGFGLKVTATGGKSYVVQYRTAGGRRSQTKRITIGKHGSPWTAETARTEAKRILGLVAQGEDPSAKEREARQMLTVSELCDLYLKEGTGTKKPSTLATDRGRIARHIKPLVGKLRVNEVTPADIRRFMTSVADGTTAADVKTKLRGRAIVKGGKGTASRTLGLLGGIFSYAMELGLIAANPAHGVKRYASKKSERFLSNEEIAIVGRGLKKAEADGVNAQAIAIIRLLIYTGARRGEIEGLRWSEVDFDGKRLRLDDSKTGQKNLPLNSATLAILSARKEKAGDSPHVFPAERGDGHYCGTPRIWSRLRASIGMNDVRLHDLRHSFASIGVMSGTPLMIVGALLGHANHNTTQRYAHLADDPVSAASEQIGSAIEKVLNPDSDSSA